MGVGYIAVCARVCVGGGGGAGVILNIGVMSLVCVVWPQLTGPACCWLGPNPSVILYTSCLIPGFAFFQTSRTPRSRRPQKVSQSSISHLFLTPVSYTCFLHLLHLWILTMAEVSQTSPRRMAVTSAIER